MFNVVWALINLPVETEDLSKCLLFLLETRLSGRSESAASFFSPFSPNLVHFSIQFASVAQHARRRPSARLHFPTCSSNIIGERPFQLPFQLFFLRQVVSLLVIVSHARWQLAVAVADHASCTQARPIVPDCMQIRCVSAGLAFLSNADQHILRTVATDQWLVSHFAASWKVAEVKQYILSKVSSHSSDHFSFPSRHRPVSPITFASAFRSRGSLDNPSEDSFDELDDVYDDGSDSDLHLVDVAKPPRPKQSPVDAAPSPITAHATHRYPLVMFSTGQLLEDDYSLSWYHLRPHELLELHPPGAVIRLPREIMHEYVKPYFEAKVKALRVIRTEKDARVDKPRPGGQSPGEVSSPTVMLRRRKAKLEWRERWVIIHQGMLNLFKDRSVCCPMILALYTHPLSVHSIHCGMPQTYLANHPGQQKIHTSFASNLSWATAPVVHIDRMIRSHPRQWMCGLILGLGERSRKKKVTLELLHGVGEVRKKTFLRAQKGKGRGSNGEKETRQEADFVHDIAIDDGTEGLWVVLDMLDAVSYCNILRVLHRHSPESVNSSFVPNKISSHMSPPSTLLNPTSTTPFPYPEWRKEVAGRAQKAGMGDVGHAMAFIMWGERHSRTLTTASTVNRVRKPSAVARDAEDQLLGPLDFESDGDGDSDSGILSEMEWDGWVHDLARQGRMRDRALPEPAHSTSPFIADRGSSVRHSGVSSPSSTTSPSHRGDLSPLTHTPISGSTSMVASPTTTPPKGRPYSPLSLDGLNPLSAHSPALLTTHSLVPAGALPQAQFPPARFLPRAMKVVQEDESPSSLPKKLGKGKLGKKHDDKRDKDKDRDRDKDRERRTLSSTASTVRPLKIVPLISSAQSAVSPTIITQDEQSMRRRFSAVLGQASSFGSLTGSLAGEPSSLHDTASDEQDDDDTEGSGNRRKKLVKGMSLVKRSKAFSPERLVRGLDSALDFVDGR
ncbi:hypothetical protein EW146_g7340 [Bondarzewia mesenterica]|uniref:Uncharacterized protein n=1 Tax=Bondarzewia mesenterica TaxID=1095465 RepID=A0A4S4LRN8_9AGAM|nr:hypothetical protein EW146_g7340 [Bondarzewia mesenterica]